MAQQMTVYFVDDIDGGEADGTVTFGLDNRSYEIDLSANNASKLREVLAPYVGAARKVGAGGRTVRRSSTSTVDRERTKAIREWAQAQGMNVSSRGRISGEVMKAYANRDTAPVNTARVALEVETSTDEVAVPATKSRRRPRAPEPASSDTN